MLVTHQLQYLPAADTVLVLRGGRLAEQGSFQELVARGVDFHQFEHQEADGVEDSAALPTVQAAAADTADHIGGSSSDEAADVVPGADVVGRVASAAVSEGPVAAGAGDADTCSSISGSDSGRVIGSVGGREPDAVALLRTPDEQANPRSSVELKVGWKPILFAGAGQPVPFCTQHLNIMLESRFVFAILTMLQFVPKPAPVMAPTQKALLVPPPSASTAAATSDGKLVKEEERAVGQVDRSIYLQYFRSWGPAFSIPASILALAIIERGLQVCMQLPAVAHSFILPSLSKKFPHPTACQPPDSV